VELCERDTRQRRPKRFSRDEVETLVQVDASANAFLIDVEESTEPRAEEPDHIRIAVREPHFPVRFGALSRVQRYSGDKERLFTEPADALNALAVQIVNLPELGLVGGVRAPVRPVSAR
jgi:hypothetical protein